ncbi:MAG: VWA domain-containing protein, partial [Proteobacteria bacterium]
RKTAFVDVTGARTALVISGVVPGPSPLEGWLRDGGFQVKHAGPTDPLDDVADFAAKDLVVLEDVAAETLGEARIRALARAVTDVGTGLLLVGGKHAFGPGGYAGSPLEAVSPVSFDLKKDKNRPALAEVIVIDYSGSMSAAVGGQTKIALANEAAARSAALLSPGDSLAVAHVDTEVKWTVPLAPIEDGKALGRVIRSVDAGGGGIYSQVALEAAYAALRTVPKGTLKHVLLFADGDDAEEIVRCPPLAAAAARDEITTSVVSLGRGSDSTLLERTSSSGGGRFYLVEDARTLPEVFSQETVLASRRAFREEPVTPKATSDGSFLRGVTTLPNLDGYVVTTLKPGARLSLVGAEDEPLIADWTRGLGKVGVLTTDLAGRWSSRWLSSDDAIRLSAQLAIALAREPATPGARLGATARRGELSIEATDALGTADGSVLV